jgi:hypothetical protein
MVAFDLIIHFRVSILDIVTGEEINNPKVIFWRNIKSFTLYIDIITVIPYEVIKSNDILILVGLMKVYKIDRLKTFISNLNVKSNFKLVSLLILIH